MHAIISHLARRGFQAARFYPQEEYQNNIPIWGTAMIVTTFLLFAFAAFSIEYTYGRIVPTLVMVESPQAVAYEPLDIVDSDPSFGKKSDPELLLVKQKPITSSFRSTIKHLHSKGEFRSRFRGLVQFIIYGFTLSIVSGLISTIPFLPRRVASVLGTILLANLSLRWTHLVISDPSPKPWFRRFPDLRAWRKIAGPTALLAVAEQLCLALPELLTRVYGLDYMNYQNTLALSDSERHAVGLKGLSILGLAVVLGLFVVLPVNVMVTRVQASLLPDDQDSIVPFDRSYNGKVIPEIVGGAGVLSLGDAWSTFDKGARVRLIKTYIKVFAMQTALIFMTSCVFAAEIFFIVGESELKKLIFRS